MYRSSARQGNDTFEPRRIVLEFQLAAVQPRHRSGQAQAEARARLRAALLKPHKTLDHPWPVGFRDARPLIRDAEQNSLALVQGANDDLRLLAVDGLLLLRTGIFDSVIHEVG